MNRVLQKIICSVWLLAALTLPAPLRATLSDDFHGVQTKLNDSLLDVYSGENNTNLAAQITAGMASLKPYVSGYAQSDAEKMLNAPLPSGLSAAGQIGVARARLQHVAALAMLQCQQTGNIAAAMAGVDHVAAVCQWRGQRAVVAKRAGRRQAGNQPGAREGISRMADDAGASGA